MKDVKMTKEIKSTVEKIKEQSKISQSVTRKITNDWIKEFFVIEDSILQQKESMTIEFKGIFDWESKEARAKYAKTCAAFANNRGGYLIFGVENKTHKVSSIDNFGEIGDAEIATFLNNHFTPHIEFESLLVEIEDVKVGVIYIHESENKPIICYRDTAATSTSDIYYRYEEQSEKIKPGELRIIIDEVKRRESDKWAQIIQNIAKIGVDNVGVLNTVDGVVNSRSNTFVLDEKLLKQIKIVDRYSERDEGAPALKIIGEIPEVGRIITQAKAIFECDILNAFITGETQGSPENFLKAILHQNSEYYPIYYFLDQMNLSLKEGEEFIKNAKARTAVAGGVLRRLKNDNKLEGKSYAFVDTPAGRARKAFYEGLRKKGIKEIKNNTQILRFCEAIFSIKSKDVDLDYLLSVLKEIYDNYYPFEKSGINYIFRWSLAYIDLIYFRK